MITKRTLLTIFCFLLSTSAVFSAETVFYGLDKGWNETVNEGLRETIGWRGKKALTLSPLGRNPFLSVDREKQDISPDEIDLLLLATPEGPILPVNHYTLEHPISVSTDFTARGEASIRLGTHPVVLGPTEMAMWAAGSEWNDFTLDFRLRPTSLRNGEVFFSWSGRDISGKTQSVVARVEHRRLIWEFTNFFRYGAHRSLNISLKSPPLIPGEWRHHQIRFKRDLLDTGRSGASPGLLEYLLDGVPSDMVHATPDGRENAEPFAPRIGTQSRGALLIGPSFSGYIDEFRLASDFASNPPSGGYTDREASATGKGRTAVIDAGYPSSSLESLRARISIPGESRVRFYVRSFESRKPAADAPPPDSLNPDWKLLPMAAEARDPTGSGRWYSWKPDENPTPVRGRYFVVGYILDSDPAADIAPLLSALEVRYEPRKPPRAPREIRVQESSDGQTSISWRSDAETGVAGWWIFWGPRPGDYSPTSASDTLRGSAWIARNPERADENPRFLWPSGTEDRLFYCSVRAAWSEAAPAEGSNHPADYKALSEPSVEISFRP